MRYTQTINIKATPFLVSVILLLCWIIPSHASEDAGSHSSTHQTEHSTSHEKIDHTEHGGGHEAVHEEHAEHAGEHETTHPQHGGEHETSQAVHAEQAREHETTHVEHGGEHEAHDTHGNGHHAPPPSIYYINWGILGFAFLISCFYCLFVYKRGKPKHEGLALAFFLVLLVIALYGTNQFPEVQRHFDPASHSFVDGYHESSPTGFIKFIYKMLLGVFLTIHGLIGMEHH